MMAIFIFSFGICLGTLFTSLQLQGQDFAFLISVFGIFGGIAFLTGIIGFTINDRAHLTLTKINYIASFVALLAIIVVIILGFFLNLSWIEMGLMSLFCVLSVLYLV
jgi:hypothetical protein